MPHVHHHARPRPRVAVAADAAAIEARGRGGRLEVRFDITWHIQDGRIIKQTTGGEPAGKVALILKAMGDRAEEPIQKLTRDRLILLDQNGKTTYHWVRAR